MRAKHQWCMVALAIFGLALAGCDKAEDSIADEPFEPTEMPDFGGVEVVKIDVDGVGPTRNAAILDGLNLAVRQVSGVPLASISLNSQGSLDYGQEGPNDFGITNETVLSMTQGSVKSFTIRSEKRDPNNEAQGRSAGWRVSLSVEVNKYQAAPEAKLPKIIVASPRTTASEFIVGDDTLSAREVASAIQGQIGQSITESGRFALIDRRFDGEIDQELAEIAVGKSANQEIAKLGQRMTADLIVIPEIRQLAYRKSGRSLRYSGRELRSYSGSIDVSFYVVNVATGLQIINENYQVQLPSTPPSVYGRQRVGLENVRSYLADIAEQFSQKLIMENFPIMVVKLSGKSLVLSQGKSMLSEGESYGLVKIGEKITDPQTGLVIGRLEEEVGTVRITKAMDRMSFGLLVTGSIDPKTFKPGKFQLRGEVVQSQVDHDNGPNIDYQDDRKGPAKQPPKRRSNPPEEIFDADFEDIG